MSGKSIKSYEVGYGKPPKATRFKKGTSGNPSGRPKKKSLQSTPEASSRPIDNEQIEVSDNGKRKTMTKAEIEIRQLFTRAIRGNLPTARLASHGHGCRIFCRRGQGRFDYEFIGETEAKKRFGRNWQIRIQELNMSRGYQR